MIHVPSYKEDDPAACVESGRKCPTPMAMQWIENQRASKRGRGQTSGNSPFLPFGCDATTLLTELKSPRSNHGVRRFGS